MSVISMDVFIIGCGDVKWKDNVVEPRNEAVGV